MASWAAPKWAQPRDRGTPRITKTGTGDAGNTPGRRRRRRRASSSTQSRRRPSRRRAGAASTRPRGAARPTARLRSRESASMASGGVLSPRTECRENATPRRRGGGAPQGGARTSKEQKDTVSEPGSAATTSTRRSDRSAARLLRGRVAFASRRSRDFGRGSVQRGKRKRDGSSQRRVRGQEARQDRDDHDAQREFQRARAARRRTVGGGALLGQRPAGHARAFVDVVGVARGRVDVGVPAVPVAVQHHLDCPAAAALDSSAGAQVPQQRRAGRGRVPHRYATAARGLDGARTPNLECCDLG